MDYVSLSVWFPFEIFSWEWQKKNDDILKSISEKFDARYAFVIWPKWIRSVTITVLIITIDSFSNILLFFCFFFRHTFQLLFSNQECQGEDKKKKECVTISGESSYTSRRLYDASVATIVRHLSTVDSNADYFPSLRFTPICSFDRLIDRCFSDQIESDRSDRVRARMWWLPSTKSFCRCSDIYIYRFSFDFWLRLRILCPL